VQRVPDRRKHAATAHSREGERPWQKTRGAPSDLWASPYAQPVGERRLVASPLVAAAGAVAPTLSA